MAFEINVQDFIDEAEDQIRVLNDGLLALEKDKTNQEIINEVFRAAHTLKGGSGLVGFTKMTELTHNLESIFDLIREKELALTSAHLDVMFESLDVLMELMGEVDSGQFNTDITSVVKKLKTIIDARIEIRKANKKKLSNVAPNVVPTEEVKVENVQKVETVETVAKVESDTIKADEKAQPVAPPVAVKEEPKIENVEKHINKEEDKSQTLEERIFNVMGRELNIDERKALINANECDDPLYSVVIVVGDACDVASLFMFMIFNKIREMGEILFCNPEEDDLEDDECKNVSLVFSSILPIETVKKELIMPEIQQIAVSLLTRDIEDEEVVESAPVQVVKDVSAPGQAVVQEKVVIENPATKTQEPSEEKGIAVIKDSDAHKKGGVSSHTLRVDSNKIDGLLNLAGELVINKARFVQIQVDLEKVVGKNAKVGELKDTVVQLMRITNELQEGIMQLRMVSIDQVFSKFPRVVRDVSRKLNKKINLIIEGKDTELDKSVVEEIGDPLMHLVRNAVDHGVETIPERIANGKSETGKIILRAYHQGSSIVIEIEDDGKGIDVVVIKNKAVEKGLITEEESSVMTDKEAVNLIFMPGFSTAAVVSDLSGRGVGMDVVKKNVERLNGVVEITTEKGKGSVFTIKLPLTLAIISTLLTKVTRFVYAIPLVNVIEIVEVSRKDISKIAKKEAIKIRNEVINILRLDEIFNLSAGNRGKERIQVVIVGVAQNRVGFVVDELIGEQEVVIKSLDNSMIDSPGIAGASILGDGNVALIIDVSTLIDKVIQGVY